MTFLAFFQIKSSQQSSHLHEIVKTRTSTKMRSNCSTYEKCMVQSSLVAYVTRFSTAFRIVQCSRTTEFKSSSNLTKIFTSLTNENLKTRKNLTSKHEQVSSKIDKQLSTLQEQINILITEMEQLSDVTSDVQNDMKALKAKF